MNRKQRVGALITFLGLTLIASLSISGVSLPPMFAGIATAADAIPEVPTKGMVTMVDLGAHKCIPCKMMEPVMEEVTKEYAGRASVIFIDVWEHRDQAPRFGIRAIPTQIFFDKEGKEVSRHEGYLDKASIVKMFEQLGVH